MKKLLLLFITSIFAFNSCTFLLSDPDDIAYKDVISSSESTDSWSYYTRTSGSSGIVGDWIYESKRGDDYSKTTLIFTAAGRFTQRVEWSDDISSGHKYIKGVYSLYKESQDYERDGIKKHSDNYYIKTTITSATNSSLKDDVHKYVYSIKDDKLFINL